MYHHVGEAVEKHFEVKLVIFPKLYLADKPHLIKDYQEDIVGRIINWSGLSRMTNEMMVRRAKSAKIGKTLTAFLIPGAGGDTVTVARQIVVQSFLCRKHFLV